MSVLDLSFVVGLSALGALVLFLGSACYQASRIKYPSQLTLTMGAIRDIPHLNNDAFMYLDKQATSLGFFKRLEYVLDMDQSRCPSRLYQGNFGILLGVGQMGLGSRPKILVQFFSSFLDGGILTTTNDLWGQRLPFTPDILEQTGPPQASLEILHRLHLDRLYQEKEKGRAIITNDDSLLMVLRKRHQLWMFHLQENGFLVSHGSVLKPTMKFIISRSRLAGWV